VRVTKRRAQTRARLLDAAFRVFAAKGFGAARIDDVCAAAGYTRGAFYSNFATLDELFFALYDERAAIIAAQVAEALTVDAPAGAASPAGAAPLAGAVPLAGAASAAGAAPADAPTADAPAADGFAPLEPSIHAVIARTAATLLLDRDWLLVKTDFLLYAARHPEVAVRLAAHRAELRHAIEARLGAVRGRLALPPGVADLPAAAHAVVAAYDGVTVQLLLAGDVAAAREWLTQLLTALLVR
jgi:AcrR family transcriptional regulator